MIKNLTSLRGVFILFIFLHHCLNLYPGGGAMAVSFFFVLGGFSMTLGYKERMDSSAFNYYDYLIRRLIKFYPLHWICLLAALILEITTFETETIPSFFLNAALLQTWVPIKSVYFSFNAVSWYLADTMFFAIIFPFILKLVQKTSKKGVLGIVALLFIAYIVMLFVLPKDKWHAIFYISPYMRLYDFVFGICIGMFYLNIKKTPHKLMKNNIMNTIVILVIITLLVIESCILPQNIRLIAPVFWPLVALLILIASLSSVYGGGYNLLENKWLQRLGELSFVIFLIHQLVFRYSSIIFNRFIHCDNSIVFVITTFVITIFMSTLVDRYILKPISKWLTKKNLPSMTVQ